MASNFLENLKKSVEEGNFNSEAAKKIIEIDKLADNPKGLILSDEETEIAKKLRPVQEVSEQEVAAINSEYEKKMVEIKKRDAINQQLATLIEIEDMVKLSIDDMFSFVDELALKFEKEFESEDPIYGELSQKIDDITSKYKSIINN